MKTRNIFRFIAALASLAIAVLQIVKYNINLITNFLNIWSTSITVLMFLLLSLCLFFKKKWMGIVSFAVLLGLKIYVIVSSVINVSSIAFSFFSFDQLTILRPILLTLSFYVLEFVTLILLLSLTLAKPISSKALGIAAAVISLIETLLIGKNGKLYLYNSIYDILEFVLFVSLAFGWPSVLGVEVIEQTNKQTYKKPSSDLDSFEKIAKLKELLDMNAITQEEFEQKKKELLGI